jgi:cell pole-organizing protein PopZ
MAEETQAAAADPSMEEILASIRKIISDEKPEEEAAPVAAEPEPAPVAAEPVAAIAEPAPPEDILELTQMVEEDGSVTDMTAVEAVPAAAPAFVPPPAPLAAGESLVSDTVASTASSRLSSLANTVEIERLSSSPITATMIGNGHRTLEDMALELMRPLLKDWMDQNLTGIVEKLVQKEIERIARRS